MAFLESKIAFNDAPNARRILVNKSLNIHCILPI